MIDACHSGTVTRGDTVTRSVNPANLGIPDKPTVPVEASRGGTREGTMKAASAPGEGGLAGFYAVESYDEAIERPFPGYNLPMVGDDQTQRMGVFTYLLHRALTRNSAQTFRDLAQEIVAELNMDSTGGKVPPPVFDGDLDAPVPGSDAARLAQFHHRHSQGRHSHVPRRGAAGLRCWRHAGALCTGKARNADRPCRGDRRHRRYGHGRKHHLGRRRLGS